jgi:hypothetical protein
MAQSQMASLVLAAALLGAALLLQGCSSPSIECTGKALDGSSITITVTCDGSDAVKVKGEGKGESGGVTMKLPNGQKCTQEALDKGKSVLCATMEPPPGVPFPGSPFPQAADVLQESQVVQVVGDDPVVDHAVAKAAAALSSELGLPESRVQDKLAYAHKVGQQFVDTLQKEPQAKPAASASLQVDDDGITADHAVAKAVVALGSKLGLPKSQMQEKLAYADKVGQQFVGMLQKESQAKPAAGSGLLDKLLFAGIGGLVVGAAASVYHLTAAKRWQVRETQLKSTSGVEMPTAGAA